MTNKWIKTTDRLPPPNTKVLIYWKYGGMYDKCSMTWGIGFGSYRSRVE